MATSNRNITVTKDEYAFFGRALPYIAMGIGAGLLFALAVVLHFSIWAQAHWGDADVLHGTKVTTWAILVVGTILCAICWKLFSQRRGLFIAPHATITAVLCHLWLILSLWDGKGDWTFGILSLNIYFIGAAALIISWCIRRWAFRDDNAYDENNNGDNVFDAIGLGESHIDKRNSKRIDSGVKYRVKAALGKTVTNFKDKREQIAQIAGKPVNQVHISEAENGIAGLIDVTILDKNPFGTKTEWKGPEYAGESITYPITYATYDTGERPELYLAGKNGNSCQHFLTMGMSGAGKSKAWQVIYGSVLCRNDVSVLFADPAKGMQTGGPLAAGLEWFEWTQAGCEQMIQSVIDAIPARTNYLTAKGLDHWMPGCGLNFVIFHLEEAARFAKVDDLIELIEAARSAGITIVVSLQRATNDRLKTSARYNLGGNMCFGVKMKRDASFGLSEYAIESGATPHLWQDRFAGYHYLEAQGVDTRMAGHPLLTDWIDMRQLELEVDKYASSRRVLDEPTATALGVPYAAYREKVNAGTTAWQEMRRNRGHDGTTLDFSTEPNEVPTQEELPFNVEVVEQTDTRVVATVKTQRSNLQTDPDETLNARMALWTIIADMKAHGQNSFFTKDLTSRYSGPPRTNKWITDQLARWVRAGFLVKLERGNYQIVDSSVTGEITTQLL